MIVFARSSPFQEGMYSKGVTLTLPMASQCTPVLLKVALTGTKWVYQEGVRFKKAGVVMMGLVPDTLVQGNLFDDDASRERSRRLMQVVDKINGRMGAETIGFAVTGIARP